MKTKNTAPAPAALVGDLSIPDQLRAGLDAANAIAKLDSAIESLANQLSKASDSATAKKLSEQINEKIEEKAVGRRLEEFYSKNLPVLAEKLYAETGSMLGRLIRINRACFDNVWAAEASRFTAVGLSGAALLASVDASSRVNDQREFNERHGPPLSSGNARVVAAGGGTCFAWPINYTGLLAEHAEIQRRLAKAEERALKLGLVLEVVGAPQAKPAVAAPPLRRSFNPAGEASAGVRIELRCLESSSLGRINGRNETAARGDIIDLPFPWPHHGADSCLALFLLASDRFEVVGKMPNRRPGTASTQPRAGMVSV